jgi:hypothetical protein
MSSWVCPDKTINRIVTYLHNLKDSWITSKILKETGFDVHIEEQAEKFAIALRELNLRGTGQRYDTDRAKTIDSFQVKEYAGFRIELASPIQVLKSIHCLHYQCCEGDTDEQPLYKLLDEIGNYVANEIVSASPEYNQAEWE